MQFLLIFSLLIAILAVAFALQNSATVTISFIVWRFDSSLALVLLIAVAAGALASAFASLPALISTRWALATRNRKIASLESQIAELQSKQEEPSAAPDPSVPTPS